MDDTTVIVTGGASGIGRATCLQYADEGASIVVADRQTEPREGGTPTHEQIIEAGGDAMYVETDVTDWDSVQAMVDEVLEVYEQIDILVNNAGVAENGPVEDFSNEWWERIMRVNLDGVFYCTKAVIPHMKDHGSGSIVNISSGAGKTGFPNLAAYCASKFGVIGFTESVAKELQEHGIPVNAVCPGRTQTAMTDFEGVSPEQVAETILAVSQADYTGRAVDV